MWPNSHGSDDNVQITKNYYDNSIRLVSSTPFGVGFACGYTPGNAFGFHPSVTRGYSH
jgi:hypothetical protein